MGKRKGPYNAYPELTFLPQISKASRKLASRRLSSLGDVTHGLPHYMLKVQVHKTTPLGPITSGDRRAGSKYTTVPETRPDNNSPIMNRSVNLTPKTENENDLFTFKPKVSSASAKIVENLGTDFMARQQQHLEKQKRILEQASQKNRNGRLSPMGKSNSKKNKELAKEDGPQDTEVQVDDATEQSDIEVPADGRLSREVTPSPSKGKISSNLQRILEGPYSSGSTEMALKKLRPPGTSQRPLRPRNMTRPHSDGDDTDDEVKENVHVNQSSDPPTLLGNMRSKTMPLQMSLTGRPKLGRRSVQMNGDRLKVAKDFVDKAIRNKKVFTIQGGYSSVRNSLRKRGWVEKFYRLTAPSKKAPGTKRKRGSDDDDDDNDDDDDGDVTDDDDGHKPDEAKIPPWQEEDGLYGIMSRLVRNVNPTFIWVLRRDAIDYRYLVKEQMVNHFCKAGSFTTKVGLCVNMKNVPWYEQADPDAFFPRCYRLSQDEDRDEFVDDYRLTTCMNIVKIVIHQSMDGPESERDDDVASDHSSPSRDTPIKAAITCTNPECSKTLSAGEKCVHIQAAESEQTQAAKAVEDSAVKQTQTPKTGRSTCSKMKKKKRVVVPLTALEFSMTQCEKFLHAKDHEDIDETEETKVLSPGQWDQLIQWYYELVHDHGLILNVPVHLIGQCENLLNRLKTRCPQLEMDGTKNVWIVKPGAKSRGRGIVCYDRLEDMLKLVSSHVVKKEGKYVVQKYIERPLLIYNTKFDIRQWFLVTDWNPLTLWFYQDCYLRFCSQEYTLDKFDESIHLSNNAIQKNYKNGPRSNMLPDDNMWSHYEFQDFLMRSRQGNLWEAMIYPEMKKAIICALLATQDLVEYRKCSFELYGADFMLTEDYKPWLIEINCSPSMEASTAVTAELCASVLEDTIKVAVDRRVDRNCDTGRFELAYKQSQVTVPPYMGLNLAVDGQAIKKPPWLKRQEAPPTREPIVPGLDDGEEGEGQNAGPGEVGESKEKLVEEEKGSDQWPGAKSQPKKLSHSSPAKKSVSAHSQTPAAKGSHSAGQVTQESLSCGSGKVSTGTQSEAFLPRERKEKTLSQSLPHPPMNPKGLASPTTMYSITGGRRIVSRTSVANNYPVMNVSHSHRERQSLQLNTVDSKTIQTHHNMSTQAHRGVHTNGVWASTCSTCGGGVILNLDNPDFKVTPGQGGQPDLHCDRKACMANHGGPGRPKRSRTERTCDKATQLGPRPFLSRTKRRQQQNLVEQTMLHDQLDSSPEQQIGEQTSDRPHNVSSEQLHVNSFEGPPLNIAEINSPRKLDVEPCAPQVSLYSLADQVISTQQLHCTHSPSVQQIIQSSWSTQLPGEAQKHSSVSLHPLISRLSQNCLTVPTVTAQNSLHDLLAGRPCSARTSSHALIARQSSSQHLLTGRPPSAARDCQKGTCGMQLRPPSKSPLPRAKPGRPISSHHTHRYHQETATPHNIRHSQFSPPGQPPSTRHPVNKPWASLVTSSTKDDKILLRYTDGGIQRPISPSSQNAANPLPKVIRKYIGRKTTMNHDLAAGALGSVFINTRRPNNTLSIVSQAFYK